MQTIGQKLKAAREEKRLTLEKVFEITRIRIPYLQALEMDDLSSMPSPVQARGYLRNYAEFLGLDFEKLLDEMRAAQKASDEIIGPADIADQPATQTPKPALSEVEAPAQEAPPPSQPEIVSSTQTESQPEISASSPIEEAPVSKPKTSRRKKGDSSPTPKARVRKKVESEEDMIPVVESQAPVVEEPASPSAPEPVIEEAADPQEEIKHQPDVSDNLWQTWLNRLHPKPAQETLEPDGAPSEMGPETLEMQEQAPAFQSAEIFKEIGAELRQRRELLSLHLDEVERNTHVKAHYLDALEKGAMDDLPSTVQTRGMLSNYATFLDLDVDALLLRFADGLQARHRERNPHMPARKPSQPIIANIPSIGSFIAGDVIFGVGMAVLLIAFSVWGVSRVITLQSQREGEIEPTAPSISHILLASPDPSSITPTATLKPIESIADEPTVTIVIPTLSENISVQLNLVAVERTFMRVTVDGEVVFEGRVVPGTAYPYEAQNQIELLVGSGAAIRIVYNGRDLGLLGGFGQVVDNVYTANEILTPTALPTLTATNTAPPSPTPRSTITPVPSSTAVP